ncbi:uncharacterized protein EV420DRAFT_1568062 [Desarmillaria tabescens]|uniref:Protein kinase domain-containing protein n=1 Tax=Armillaria tabescens TaxID=1929756 RepID=A0AA39JS21_ARMTA|nr:uncharacterized protein EV420DRAFT_1568062 [Desarmillaria tabescens]KAK0447877.1 hypothetical protein EV420DRAFT_1568062 [Desarmillaria tabescens]
MAAESCPDQINLSSINALKDYPAAMDPLRIGWTYIVELPPHPAPPDGPYRPLPQYAHNGGTYKLILVDAPLPFQHDDQYSQVWIADVHTLGMCKKKLGKVIMKIIQPSLLPLPDLDWYLEVYDYVRPWTLWRTEDAAYRELEPLQGKTVPYYFRKHKITMPSGEDAQVLIMEYVEGKTLDQWLEDRPAHNTPEDLGEDNEAYVEQMKRMFKKVLLGVHAINKLGVGHSDMRPGNIIITPSEEPVVFDFTKASCKVDPDQVRECFDNPIMATAPLRDCCTQHDDEIADWIEDEFGEA